MNFRYSIIMGGLFLCCCLMTAVPGFSGEAGSQFLIGVTSLDEDEIDFKEVEGLEDFDLKDKMNLSDLISIGAAGYSNLSGEKTGVGIEYGAIFSWMADDVDSNTADGQVEMSADGSLILFDVFLGPQVNTRAGDKVRFYGGAGPLLMYGHVSADFEEENNQEQYKEDISENDSSLGIGGYLRAGAEFSISRDSALGLGVRWFTASLDFNDTLGDVDFNGPQIFFNYTSSF
jgi:opacity protein-like surface antigen